MTKRNTTKPTPPQGGIAGFLGRLAKIVGGVLATLVLAIAVAVVFAIPIELDWVKGKVETAAAEALGRPFAIEGPLTLIPSVPPAAQIEGVRIGNPPGWADGDLAELGLARAQLRILPLLQGEILIEEIAVEGLHLHLETNAAGEPNWLLAEPEGQHAADEAAAPEPEPKPAAEPKALAFIELAELSLSDIVLRHHDAATGKDFELAVEEISGSAEDQEPMHLLVRGTVQHAPYQLTFEGGSLAALTTGAGAWPLAVRAEVLGATLAVTGEIAEPLRGKGLTLEFEFNGPSMQDLEVLLETRLPPIEAFALTGRIEEQGGSYRLADLAGEVAGTGVTGRFEADTSGDKLRLLGDIDIRTIDAGPLAAAIEEQERKTPGRGPAAEAPKQTDPKPGQTPTGDRPAGKLDLDQPVLALDVLEKFDARFELRVHEVTNGPVALRDASLAVTVAEGRLSAPVAVTLAEVPFKGELSLASEDGKPRLAVSLSSEKSDIGELARWLAQVEGIEGGFDRVSLAFATGGESVRSLVESAELTLEIDHAALSYGHETGGKPVEFTLEEANLRFPAQDDSRVEARGSLLGEAFTLELSGGTFIDNLIHRRIPAKLKATGGGAELLVDGLIQKRSEEGGTRIDFSFRGERLGGLAAWLGVSPEASQSYAVKGRVEQDLSQAQALIAEAHIGNSAFSGKAGVRKEGNTPVTFADLDFQVLDLKGLAGMLPEASGEKKGMDERRDTRAEALRIDVPILPKGIEIFDSDIDISIARIKLDPADITDVTLSSQIRNGHVEKAPIAAVVAGTRFDGGFGLDLRGEVPTIGLQVHSGKADVGALLAQLGVMEGLAMTAGGFDLDIALKGATTRAMLENSTLSVAIGDGAWDFRAPGAQQALPIRFPEASLRADPGQPITLAIDGRIEDTPVTIQVTTDTLDSFAEPKEKLSMEVVAALAQAKLQLSGAAPLPVQAENLHFTMDFGGNRLSDFDRLLDVALPPIGPYRLRGGFGTRATGFYVDGLTLTIGDSALTGTLELETARQPPRLDLELVAERIQLDDFDVGEKTAPADAGAEAADQVPAEDEEKPAGGRSLLSPEVMRSLDAKLLVRVDQVLSGTDALGSGVLTAQLDKGRFSMEQLTLDLPGGSADVSFALEPDSSGMSLETRADIEQLDYGILARRIDPQSTTGGIISLDLDLKTRGPDLARIMESANGHLDFGLWPEDLNAGLFELWAVNVITALMQEMDKGEASKVNCVIVRFRVDDGLMQERVVYADTTKMRVEGTAEVNFKNRTLDVSAKPKAKRPEFFSLAVPVGLSGKFDEFGLDINPVVLTGKAISFVTSPLHVPIRRLFKKGEPPDGQQACAEIWGAVELDAVPAPAAGASNRSGAESATEPVEKAVEASPAQQPGIDVLNPSQ